MSTLPEHDPFTPEPSTPSREDSLTPEEVLSAVNRYFPYEVPEPIVTDDPAPIEPPLFHSWSDPEFHPPQPRIPNLGHLLLLGVLAFVGLLGSSLLVRFGIHFHLFGVS